MNSDKSFIDFKDSEPYSGHFAMIANTQFAITVIIYNQILA